MLGNPQLRGPVDGMVAGLAAATLALALAAAPAGNAQEAEGAPEAPIELAPVVVEGTAGPPQSATGPVPGFVATRSAVGTKTDTPLRETPQSISVIGREQLDLQRVLKVDEATRYTAGVFSQPYGSDPRTDWFYIRGFNVTATGLYKDSLQLFSTAFISWKIDPFALERIDVLKGPSSVLFGASAPGGLVNLVDKRPPMESLRYLESGIDTNANYYGAYDFGGPLSEDGRFLYRLTGRGNAGGTENDYTDDESVFLAPAFTWRPNERTSLTLLAYVDRDWTGTPSTSFLPYQGTETRSPGNGRIPLGFFTGDKDRNKYHRDQALLGYEFEHRLDEVWQVRQNFRYSHQNTYFRALYPFGYTSDAQDELFRVNFKTSPEADVWTVDNQVQADFSTGPIGHKMLAGVDYKRFTIDDDQATAFDVQFPLDLRDPVYDEATHQARYARYIDGEQTLNDVGFYLQDQIKLTPRLILTASGRYDATSLETQSRLATGEPTTQRDQDRTSGRIGLNYLFDNGITPYVSASTFFNPVVGTDAQGRPFKAEDGVQYEAGIKYEPPGWNSSLTAAAFHLTRNNVLTPDEDNPFNNVQEGKVRSRGVEVEAVAAPIPGLALLGAFSAYDLEVLDSNAGNEGKQPLNVPEVLASAFADYTLQTTALKGLGAGAGLRYQGQSYADDANDYRVDDALVADAVVHYERAGVRVALNATNLFDKTYVASCAGVSVCSYAEGRRVVLSLALKW